MLNNTILENLNQNLLDQRIRKSLLYDTTARHISKSL
jgi:hypothetical protein